MNKPSKRAEREAREAAWEAERERVRKLEAAFEALPATPEKAALLEAMSDRIIELYNAAKWTEGDAILEFLPSNYAHALLDWYFDEDPNAIFTPPTPPAEHAAAEQRQVQGEPQADCGAHGQRDVKENAEQEAI